MSTRCDMFCGSQGSIKAVPEWEPLKAPTAKPLAKAHPKYCPLVPGAPQMRLPRNPPAPNQPVPNAGFKSHCSQNNPWCHSAGRPQACGPEAQPWRNACSAQMDVDDALSVHVDFATRNPFCGKLMLSRSTISDSLQGTREFRKRSRRSQSKGRQGDRDRNYTLCSFPYFFLRRSEKVGDLGA